jgi:8-oxo-dGTP diphosphatase
MRSLDRVQVRAGIGLEGDRYALGMGHYSENHRVSRDITLVEAEVLDDLHRDHGVALPPGGTRRNLTTRGIRLPELIGRQFLIGDVVCQGTGLCEPCQYLADLAGQAIVRPLTHRAGLRADVLTDGEMRVSDSISPVAPTTGQPLRGVGVLLIRDGRVLVGQRRGPHGRGTWSVPGGRLLRGESDEACARRELFEETGLAGAEARVVAEMVTTFAEPAVTYRSRFVTMRWRDGVPQAREPSKCRAWEWHEWKTLPRPLFLPLVALGASGFRLEDVSA